jgi:hypothetical protein
MQRLRAPGLHTLAASLLVGLGFLAMIVPPASSEDVPPVSAGMVIHVDPRTGDLLREPAPGSVPLQLGPELSNALSTAHQGLVEVPSPAAGGGVTVDLQGRFQNPLIVTIDAAGRFKMHHLQP